MSLIRFDKNTHDINTLKVAEEVEQGEIKFITYTSKSAPLLFSEGFNPCIGIVLGGEIVLSNTPHLTHQFVVLNHNEGLKKDQYDNVNHLSDIESITKIFCRETIREIVDEITMNYNFSDIKTIQIFNSCLIRIIQSPSDDLSASIQNAIADEFKSIFTDIEKLEDIFKGFAIKMHPNYYFTCIEEKEQLDSEGDCNTFNCYLRSNREGQLEVIYLHDNPAENVNTQASELGTTFIFTETEIDVDFSNGSSLKSDSIALKKHNSPIHFLFNQAPGEEKYSSCPSSPKLEKSPKTVRRNG